MSVKFRAETELEPNQTRAHLPVQNTRLFVQLIERNVLRRIQMMRKPLVFVSRVHVPRLDHFGGGIARKSALTA